MAYPKRLTVGPVMKKRLTELTVELQAVLEQKKALEERETQLKKQIREIAASYDLPVQDGASQYLNLPDGEKALAVVRPERAVTVIPEKFRERVGDEIFHHLCVIKSVDFDMSRWALLRAEERVTDADLMACIPEDAKEPTLTIKIAKARAEKGGAK
jgi:hypothetical protein